MKDMQNLQKQVARIKSTRDIENLEARVGKVLGRRILNLMNAIEKGNTEFSNGYFCALAAMVSAHGDMSEVEEILVCNFMDENQMRAIGVDEGDIERLLPAIRRIEARRANY